MTDLVLIIGTGALASLFAARLTAQDIAVTMLGTWREGLAALRQHGVTLVQPDGSQQSYPVQATDNPEDCKGAKYALVLVKSWQTRRAARQLTQCLRGDGVALTLQNGLGNREALAEELGASRVALGVTTTGATLLGPGRVRPGGEGTVSIGLHSRIGPLVNTLCKANFTVEVLDNVDTLIWGKLVVNAAINPMTAVLQVPNGELLKRESARQLSAELAREVAAVAKAQGIQLAYDDPVAISETVMEKTATNNSSMFQDIQRGAPTEIEAICGAVVEVGESVGVATPMNNALWLLIRALRESKRE
ncbi:MAG: 2-dehydropantoate 2-reductase [Anaerolineales bacterium]|jgi:2-dehydropantoate 2-reductase